MLGDRDARRAMVSALRRLPYALRGRRLPSPGEEDARRAEARGK
jgi:hypothetical protein